MKSLLTVSGVVFAHICIFLLLVNGCRGNANNPNSWNDTSIYSAGASGPASAQPAAEQPAKGVPAEAQPANARPEASAPAQQESKLSPKAATPDNGETKLHTVKKGEALSTIAVRHGLTAKELADANGIALSSTLKIGQVLKIPAAKPKAVPAKPAVEGEIYIVQKGDILGTIARKNKVSVKQIKEANNLKNDNIRVGQKLVIPSKTAKKPTTEEKPADVPANEQKPEEKKPVPAETAPAEKKESAEQNNADDGALTLPEGGFGGFGFKDENAVPEEKSLTENGPATGTPAE